MCLPSFKFLDHSLSPVLDTRAQQALSLLLMPPPKSSPKDAPKTAASFFDTKEIYPGSKIKHFKELYRKTGIAYEDMVCRVAHCVLHLGYIMNLIMILTMLVLLSLSYSSTTRFGTKKSRNWVSALPTPFFLAPSFASSLTPSTLVFLRCNILSRSSRCQQQRMEQGPRRVATSASPPREDRRGIVGRGRAGDGVKWVLGWLES